MPTYEYKCKDCGEGLEAVQAFTDDPLTECPACGGSLKKVFGSIGISFKGSGFYKTDARSGASSSASSSSNGSGSSESSDSSESKGSSESTTSDSSSSSSSSSDSKTKTAPKVAEKSEATKS